MKPASQRSRKISACLVLFAVNALFCWRLFRVEYLDTLGSNEGTYITFAKFVLDHWPHIAWFPLFNAGLPFENTYLPLTSFLVATGAFLSRQSPAHVFHFIGALAFSLAPVFWFLLARKLSGRWIPSFLAALLWSLYSPAFLIRRVLEHDADPMWGSRRLQNIVNFGETPHNLALCLIPLALLTLAYFLERPTARRFATVAAVSAIVMLSNAFGITVLAAGSVMLAIARNKFRPADVLWTGSILLTAYLLICRFLPPSLIELIRINSPTVDGDFRVTPKTRLIAVGFVGLLIVIVLLSRRLADPMLRFAAMFSGCFGGIAILWYSQHLAFLPQPHRYDLEMEIGVCWLIVFAFASLFQGMPRKAAWLVSVAFVPVCGWFVYQDYWFGRHLVQPLNIRESLAFDQAQRMNQLAAGQRVVVPEYGPWFNLFSNDPQFGSGHEPTAPNWMQRVAMYVFYSGAIAGDPDAHAAVFWLKAFGCGAIAVQDPGRAGPVSRADRFDVLLPTLYRGPDYSIYQIPQHSTSLAHVIPASAVVSRRPIHGLDLDPARAYVAALDDPFLPRAELTWKNPPEGHLTARVAPGQVISLQMTYDPGWRAEMKGQPVPLHADQLGLIVIEPNCNGDCSVDLEFSGGPERRICTLVSVLVLLGLIGASIRRRGFQTNRQ